MKMPHWDSILVPHDWYDCPRTATRLIQNKFLAFKIPLSPFYNSEVPEEYRFTVEMFLAFLRSQKLELGLWIDLTDTISYYDQESIKDNGCKYLQLRSNEIPSLYETRFFMKICNNFISQNPLGIIGVHCMDGFNRTGFSLISYLVETRGISVDAALIEFATARPPGIYKGDYIQELYRRYDDVLNAPPPPPRPSWCLEEDDSNVDDTDEGSRKGIDEYGENPHSKKKKSKVKFKKARKLVMGVELGNKKPTELLKEMLQLLGRKGSHHLYNSNLWMERLPSHVQEILAIIDCKDILKQAKIADKILEGGNNLEIVESDESYKKSTELLKEMSVSHGRPLTCKLWLESLPSCIQEILAIINHKNIIHQARIANKILKVGYNSEIAAIFPLQNERHQAKEARRASRRNTRRTIQSLTKGLNSVSRNDDFLVEDFTDAVETNYKSGRTVTYH